MSWQSVSRRGFLKGAAGAAALGSAAWRSSAWPAEPREKLQEFNYSAVRLTGGPLKSQFDRIHASYLTLDDDRVLKVYRQRAGLPAPGEDMGGWYDANGFVPGHTIGQYISGLSRFANATGDKTTSSKVKSLVEGYAATLGPDGYPYASQKASTTWPCYVLDKYVIGLLDAYRLAGVTVSRDLVVRVIRGAIPYIPDHTYDRGPDSPKRAPYDEPYILPENLFNSYELTGEKQFLEMAKLYLLNREYFDPLAQGKNVLPGKHAYSHVIALSSAAKAYQFLGDAKYLQAIRNAWDMLEATQQFASGGWGPNETFVPPHEGKLGESITSTHNHFETPCGCYAHLKLARYLLRFTGEARYGDGLERVLYNTMLASKDPDSEGNCFYYSDYHPLVKKGYYHDKWPCCSGTLVQGVADYLISVYFRSPDGIYVNLFTPSQVRSTVMGVPVKLIQTTDYPWDEEVELCVDVPAPVEFTLSIRVPGWLEAEPKFTLNGKAHSLPARRGTFASIRRRWKKNDTLHLRFPLSFRTEPIDDQHSDTVAVMRGPLMYVALDPPQDLATTRLALPQQLTCAPHGSQFEYALADRRLQFKPFYAVQDESYNTYFLLGTRRNE